MTVGTPYARARTWRRQSYKQKAPLPSTGSQKGSTEQNMADRTINTDTTTTTFHSSRSQRRTENPKNSNKFNTAAESWMDAVKERFHGAGTIL